MNSFDIFIAWLKGLLKKIVIKKFFGVALGGIKGLLFNFVFNKIFGVIKLGIDKIHIYLVSRKNFKKSKKIAKKMKGAENEDDFANDFRDLP